MPASDSSAALRVASLPADIELARTLFLEYARSLEVDLCFQGFDRELATLPGAYALPSGRLLLAGPPGGAFGCAALRPVAAGEGCCVDARVASANGIGEVKRLYVRPANRGGGWGRKLAEALIADAREIGYSELKLDTLQSMANAQKLYAKLGFRECPQYYDNPLSGVVYMSLEL